MSAPPPLRAAPDSRSPGVAVAPVVTIVVFVLFLAVLAWAGVAMVARRDMTVFVPTPPGTRPNSDTAFLDTLTIDARDADTWAYVDLDRRSRIFPPDTGGWDLAFRRFDITTSGAARDLGPGTLDTLVSVPADGYVPPPVDPDDGHPAFHHWYRYGFASHLLTPNGHQWAIHTRDGRYAAFEILSYYCPGSAAGCVTIRYRYQPSGTTTFTIEGSGTSRPGPADPERGRAGAS